MACFLYRNNRIRTNNTNVLFFQKSDYLFDQERIKVRNRAFLSALSAEIQTTGNVSNFNIQTPANTNKSLQ